MNREEILGKIIEEQQRVIDNLLQSVERYKTASDLDEDDTSDPDDLARQAEAKDMQLRFEKMLAKEKNDMAFVQAERNKNYTQAELGALVETDKNYFFMAVPLPKFTVNGKEIFCISPDAPIFQKLKNKKVGDTVEMGTNTFEIKSIS